MPGALAYLNGRYIPEAELALPVNDAGVVFGATITDRCRTFHHRLFCLDDHLARFRRSCELAGVPQPLPNEELSAIAQKLAATNTTLLQPEQDLALIMIATPGVLGDVAGRGAVAGPTLAMHTLPLPFARYRPLFERGAHLLAPTIRQIAAASIGPHIKHRSRLHWWLAEREAEQAGKDAALLLDADGQVTETAAANFLLVRRGVVYTPPRSTVLEGISLRVTEDLCHQLGIAFKEQPLRLEDCLAADEAMLSSTPYCLAGVSRINETALSWPGPIFEKLLGGWSRLVGLDVPEQIRSGR